MDRCRQPQGVAQVQRDELDFLRELPEDPAPDVRHSAREDNRLIAGGGDLPHRPRADHARAAGHDDAPRRPAHRATTAAPLNWFAGRSSPRFSRSVTPRYSVWKISAALKLGDDTVDEAVERAGMIGEGHVEAVGRTRLDPFLYVVGDGLGRTPDRTPSQHETNQLADRQLLAAGFVDEELLDGLCTPARSRRRPAGVHRS